MSDRRQIKQNIGRLQRIKTWQLLILLLLAGLLSATFLRLNNIGMLERRTAVVRADKQGDQTAIFNNLFALQRYSAVHMNASSGAVYLEETYKREAQRLVEEAKKSSTLNKDVLEKADATCRAQFPGYSQAYVQCNASEQAKYTGTDQLQTAVTFPNPDLYRHEFISPVWSNDFAGWSVVICIAITGVILARLVMLAFLRLLLRKHYSSV